MPMYNTKPGNRKNVAAKVDTRRGNSEKFMKAGHKGYALCLRIEDQTVLVRWKGNAWPSAHPVAEIEFIN